jgi:alpha-beta hydrolase superfamily lysophospholipase
MLKTLMLVGELDLQAEDRTPLRLHHFAPPATPRARILVVHGRGEHGGRYRQLAESLRAREIETLAIDLRGFGASGGVGHGRGSIRHLTEYLDDIDAAVAHASASARVPVYLLGHSAGGLLVIRYLHERRRHALSIKGAIVSSPFLAMPKPLSPLLRAVVALVAAVSPDLPMGGGSGAPATRDAAAWRAYCEDPLTVRRPTARWVREILAEQARVFARAADLPVPFLVLQGGADTATLPAVSRRFADAAGASYREYPGCLHEVLNELPLDRERVLADLGTWLLARADHAPAAARGSS